MLTLDVLSQVSLALRCLDEEDPNFCCVIVDRLVGLATDGGRKATRITCYGALSTSVRGSA